MHPADVGGVDVVPFWIVNEFVRLTSRSGFEVIEPVEIVGRSLPVRVDQKRSVALWVQGNWRPPPKTQKHPR